MYMGVLKVREAITSPSADSDLSMNFASLYLSPSNSVLGKRSLPACSNNHMWVLLLCPVSKCPLMMVTLTKMQVKQKFGCHYPIAKICSLLCQVWDSL